MITANPTPIRIGMAGTLLGKRYRVLGRVLMGMTEAGVTYCWNEFNLLGPQGEPATLVCEETENGYEWRLFTLFDPKEPMTADQAAAVRVGDKISVENSTYRVSLVDNSIVYHIEGQAPEGTEVGDCARYINAESAFSKLVVSWTGNEVEYYHGQNILASNVKLGFGLPTLPRSLPRDTDDDSSASQGLWAILIPGIVAAFFILRGCDFQSTPKPVEIRKAPPATLNLGNYGELRGTTYKVRSHALTRVDLVNQRYEQQEYTLADSGENTALLIQGALGEKDRWILFYSADSSGLSPFEAASKKIGDSVLIGGQTHTVTHLFRVTPLKTEPQENATTNMWFFGLSAQQPPSKQSLILWNDHEIRCYDGVFVPAKQIKKTFESKQ